MNYLRGAKASELKRLIAAGNSTRAIARAIHVSCKTVRRYRDVWEMRAICPCGEPAGHQGWCSYRLQFPPNRAGWLADHWQKRAQTTTLTILAELARARAEAHGHTLGTFVWASSFTTTLAYATCKTCGQTVRIHTADGVRDRIDGTATRQSCLSPQQRAAIKAANQEKRTWRAAKRTLRTLKAHLRASPSRTAASAPPPTSSE